MKGYVYFGLLSEKKPIDFSMFFEVSTEQNTGEGDLIFKDQDTTMMISEEYYEDKKRNLRNYDEYLKEAADYLDEIYFNNLSKKQSNDSIIIIMTDHGMGIGEKVGEGVFGVSFKVKGPQKKLETTVNPIKTLTPRFITRTLEKIKKN